MDDPRITAFDPAAPEGERTDAMTQIQRTYMPTRSDLLPAADILAFAEQARQGYEDLIIAKAQVIGDPRRGRHPTGMQSAWIDPWMTGHGQYYEPPGMLTYDAMRTMVRKTPILAAAILTRVRQIRRFCTPQADSGPGFRIRHRDRSHKPDKEETQSIQLLEQYIENCGWEWNPLKRDTLQRDTFGDFVTKLAEDSLILDSAGFEIEHRRDKRGIAGVYAVDGATLRRCTEEGYDGDDAIFALQVVSGTIRTAYTREDLVLKARNPSSSIYRAGYGQSEVDLMIQVVTGILNTMDHNIAGFNRNEIPQGVLHISGNFDQSDADSFRAYWRNLLLGANQRWKMPILFSKDQESKASFEKFGVDQSEMMFSKWMTFLVSIVCALLGMSPDEINSEGFSAGNRSPLSGSDTAEKLASSREKGLRPNLAYFEQLFSAYLIQPLSDKYVFEWTGLEEEDAQAKQELNKLAWTWNELREAQGLKPDASELGKAPLNPSLIGPWMQLTQGQAGGAEGGGDFGQKPDEQDKPGGPDQPNAGPDGDEKGGPKARDQALAPQDQEDEDEGEEDRDPGEWGRLAKANDIHDDLGRFAGVFVPKAGQGERRGKTMAITPLDADHIPALARATADLLDRVRPIVLPDKVGQNVRSDALNSARETADYMMRNGLAIANHGSGGLIELSVRGLKHAKSYTGDLRAALLMFRLPSALACAVYFKSETPDPRKSHRGDIVAYHKFAMPVADGNSLSLAVLQVEEDARGKFYYDAAVTPEIDRLEGKPPGRITADGGDRGTGRLQAYVQHIQNILESKPGLGEIHTFFRKSMSVQDDPDTQALPAPEPLDFGVRETPIYRLGDAWA